MSIKAAIKELATVKAAIEWSVKSEKTLFCDELLAENNLLTDSDSEVNMDRIDYLDECLFKKFEEICKSL